MNEGLLTEANYRQEMGITGEKREVIQSPCCSVGCVPHQQMQSLSSLVFFTALSHFSVSIAAFAVHQIPII